MSLSESVPSSTTVSLHSELHCTGPHAFVPFRHSPAPELSLKKYLDSQSKNIFSCHLKLIWLPALVGTVLLVASQLMHPCRPSEDPGAPPR